MLWTPLKGFIDKKYKEFREDYENKYFRRILKNENEYKYEKINIKCNIISNGVSATSNNIVKFPGSPTIIWAAVKNIVPLTKVPITIIIPVTIKSFTLSPKFLTKGNLYESVITKNIIFVVKNLSITFGIWPPGNALVIPANIPATIPATKHVL